MAFQCDIPAIPTVLEENDAVRFTRWDFPPGGVTGWHQHGWPYFVVMLTPARMRVHDGEKVAEMNFEPGHSYMRPAGVTHDVMNGGDQPMSFIEIEVKRPEALVMLK